MNRIAAVILAAVAAAGCVSADVVSRSDTLHTVRVEATSAPGNTWIQRALFDAADKACPNGWTAVAERTAPAGRAWDGTPLFDTERTVRCD